MQQFIENYFYFLVAMLVVMVLLLVAFAWIMKIKKWTKGTILFPVAKLAFGVPFVIVDVIWNYLLPFTPTSFWMEFPKKGDRTASKRFDDLCKTYADRVPESIPTKRLRQLKFAKKVCRFLNKHDPGHCCET